MHLYDEIYSSIIGSFHFIGLFFVYIYIYNEKRISRRKISFNSPYVERGLL